MHGIQESNPTPRTLSGWLSSRPGKPPSKFIMCVIENNLQHPSGILTTITTRQAVSLVGETCKPSTLLMVHLSHQKKMMSSKLRTALKTKTKSQSQQKHHLRSKITAVDVEARLHLSMTFPATIVSRIGRAMKHVGWCLISSWNRICYNECKWYKGILYLKH